MVALAGAALFASTSITLQLVPQSQTLEQALELRVLEVRDPLEVLGVMVEVG